MSETLLQKARRLGCYWLYYANLAAERGDYELEQRHLARCQVWMDIETRELGFEDVGSTQKTAQAAIDSPRTERGEQEAGMATDCVSCNGTGALGHWESAFHMPCPACNGTGIIAQSELDTLRAENARQRELLAQAAAALALRQMYAAALRSYWMDGSHTSAVEQNNLAEVIDNARAAIEAALAGEQAAVDVGADLTAETDATRAHDEIVQRFKDDEAADDWYPYDDYDWQPY